MNKDLFQGVGKLYSKFYKSELIMTKTYIERNKYLSTYSKNKVVTDSFIQKYRGLTRGTVEHILQLSECVVEIKQKEKSGELNCYDIQYFCHSVGITEKGSTFRKFMCIGQRVEEFREYLDKLPNSYTVLYEITTLDPDKFEELMDNNEIHSYVTLKDIKRLGGKVPTVNNSIKTPTPLVTPSQMKKLIKSINRFTITVSRDIPKNEFDSFIEYLNNLQKKELVQFEIPQTTGYIDDETEDITDEELVTV